MDNPTINPIIEASKAYVTQYFQDHIDAEYVFHDFQHTTDVATGVVEVGVHMGITDQDLEVLQVAAWFHDTGYKDGPEGHEERSCQIAKAFLQEKNYPESKLKDVLGCIIATKMPQSPQNVLQEIICDADMSHLGKKIYWDRTGRVRQELLLTRQLIMSEQDWIDFEIKFMVEHNYFTPVATELYDARKFKHIKQLRKQKLRLNPREIGSIKSLAKKDKKKKKRQTAASSAINGNDLQLSEINLGRGVETMYRTTYRTHVNLSSIADNKANIMLSINAIIISILVSNLVPQFATNQKLIIPTLILLVACLGAAVFATLSTRPKVTEGKFTREDIEKKRSNLLFFGNYYNMDIKDFHWGMMEMIKDSDFLYSTMTRDLYYLGVVLAKKYRYLSICYSIFMYGLIFAVIGFAVAYLI